MTPYDQIANSFHARIETIAGAVDILAPGLQAAAQQIVDAVLGDQRILICAVGTDRSIAVYTAELFRSGQGGTPPLPALSLAGSGDDNSRASLWSDVRMLARDRDVLLCIDTTRDTRLAREASEVAAERNLCAQLMSDLQESQGEALLLPLHAADDNLRLELALMSVHALRDLITELLMGEL